MVENWWAWISVASALWVVGAAVWIVGERRSPTSTLAWLFALALFPILGILFYYVFGPRKVTRKKQRRDDAERNVAAMAPDVGPAAQELPWVARGISEMCQRAVGGPSAIRRSADAEVYLGGRETYAAIENAIANAQHHIHMEYYIWEADRISTRIRDQLARRAADGIEVRILLDAIGGSNADKKFWKPLVEAGGQVRWFNPIRLRLGRQFANFRTHRKIIVVDGRVGFTGGINISDVHTTEFSGEAAWRDTHVRIEGPAVHGLQLVFCEGWYDVTQSAPTGRDYFPSWDEEGAHSVQVVASGPDKLQKPIRKLFISAISSARERVFLTSPYFVPDDALLVALSMAVLRGADVRVLVPAKNDVALVGAACRSYYPDLFALGIRVYEYNPSMLHAKTLVVDDVVAVIGTANADARSLKLHFEVVLASYEAQACERLAGVFLSDLESSTEATPATVASYGRLRRFSHDVCRLFSPLL